MFQKGSNKLNYVDKQRLAAVCVAEYCKVKNIVHPYIEQLVEHLLRIDMANLPQWEQRGAKLALCGRGEKMPAELLSLISPKELPDFEILIESAVEVGIVDMYGAETNQPQYFLNICFNVLKRNSIDLPNTL